MFRQGCIDEYIEILLLHAFWLDIFCQTTIMILLFFVTAAQCKCYQGQQQTTKQ